MTDDTTPSARTWVWYSTVESAAALLLLLFASALGRWGLPGPSAQVADLIGLAHLWTLSGSAASLLTVLLYFSTRAILLNRRQEPTYGLFWEPKLRQLAWLRLPLVGFHLGVTAWVVAGWIDWGLVQGHLARLQLLPGVPL